MPIISYETKSKEVEILNQSIDISNKLFISTKADYIEVLLTQREALDSRIELIETKLKQLKAKVNIYRALGVDGIKVDLMHSKTLKSSEGAMIKKDAFKYKIRRKTYSRYD